MFRQSAADAAWVNGSKKQFGAESAAGEVGGDKFASRLRGGAWVEENDHCRTGATEGYSEDAWFPGQFLQTRQQGTELRTVRLMDAVFERH
jgi:hypothetical protein